MKEAYKLDAMKTKENMLDRIGVEYVLDYIELEDLSDTDRDQVRPLEAEVPEDLIRDTARAQADEVAMPPIIAYTPNGTKKYGIAGGFRRTAGARINEAKLIPAYVMLEPTGKQILRARILDNKEARPQTQEELIILANRLIDLHDVTVAAAALDVGLPYHVLDRARRVEKVEQIAKQRGIRVEERNSLATSTLEELARIKDHNVGKDLSRFVVDNKWTTARTRELVNAMKEARSVDGQQDILDREKRAVKEVSSPTRPDELHQLRMAVGAVIHKDFDVVLRQADTEVARQELRAKLEELVDLASTWIDQLS